MHLLTISPEKMGDDYLIELYRERRFLYDKSHQDFRDNELKNNAWKEISSIMQSKNMDITVTRITGIIVPKINFGLKYQSAKNFQL
ncbi:uncharacterized protein LOC143906466 isoform X2 [Temnothorax americanus]|uniref:uncharacterized protein LOC143906466 isoform X2 n=1 Tax=Temnothorax americanus TaxID=1964332 RepID=UPI004068A082